MPKRHSAGLAKPGSCGHCAGSHGMGAVAGGGHFPGIGTLPTAAAEEEALGQRLAASALQALGLEFCPSPPGCVHGILVGTSVGGAVPCAHAGDGAHVLSKQLAFKLIQEMPLQPKPLCSLTLMQMVEAAVEDAEL